MSADPAASKKEQKKAVKGEKKDVVYAYTVNLSKDKSVEPALTRAVELYFGEAFPKTRYAYYLDGKKSLPTLTVEGRADSSVSGDVNIARFIVRSNAALASFYGGSDLLLASQIDQWLDLYSFSLISGGYQQSLSELLESFLATRTFLVGHSFSLADLAIYVAVKRANSSALGPNASRWFSLVASYVPDLSVPIPIQFIAPPKKESAKVEKTAAVAEVATTNAAIEDGGTCPPLENAVEGQVCTRFPPEPSGYLHIGHAKAVLLNQYYAQRYNGKLIVRFDDTNPSKEKEEFEENILHDLNTLGVKPDKVSHSSDHFELLENYARQMIREGKAYMDDTDQETMQAERMKMVESKNRNTAPEENLKIFEELIKGTKEFRKYCLRAKIDMSSVNGTMRDPVLFRFNETPHHRTGTRFKAYPTYDFACPVIDAIEGVTHALRTTEYNDRDEQYHWIQKAVGLRHVYIQAFGKMNFVNTVLSKRKLTWFVENKLVEGWFDPRFPTVQGCIRRGVNVEALKNFIISQGASRRVITMEWDKFWAENKKVLEEKCPRYMAVNTQDVVEMLVENAAAEVTFHTVAIHPQKPEHGNRVMRRFNRILVDQADAATYSVGEEVTFLRWGNMKISAIEKNGDGKIVSLRATYDEKSTNFSKTKKATWLASVAENVPCVLVEFDHLISKAKLGDEEDFKDFVNPVTRMESQALADACVRLLPEGTVIQLERKGFFRIDRAYGGKDKPAVLISIPDGRAKTLNAAAAAPAAAKKK